MESNNVIKVLIIGDLLIFRNGLRMLLETRDNLKVVGEASDVSEVSSSINGSRPDVILIDSSQITNSDLKSLLSQCCENIPTIVLTNSQSAQTHQKFLLEGASGVVTKEQEPGVLFKAISQVCSDDLWFRREVMKDTIERFINERNNAPEAIYSNKYYSLTEREREVLSSICQGMKNKDIAKTLFITETTVRHHLTSIFEKLNVKSRLALAILAFNEGLVEIPAKDATYS